MAPHNAVELVNNCADCGTLVLRSDDTIRIYLDNEDSSTLTAKDAEPGEAFHSLANNALNLRWQRHGVDVWKPLIDRKRLANPSVI